MGNSHKARRSNADNTLDVKRTYTLYIDLEEADPAYEDDDVTLSSDDGTYKHLRSAKMVKWSKSVSADSGTIQAVSC